jgi:hypothetical protein
MACQPLLAISHPTTLRSPLKWLRITFDRMLPEMVIPMTTGAKRDRAVYPKAPMGT